MLSNIIILTGYFHIQFLPGTDQQYCIVCQEEKIVKQTAKDSKLHMDTLEHGAEFYWLTRGWKKLF